MGVIFLLCVIVYVAFAIVFVREVWKREKNRLRRWLAVAFVILLPSWDAVLGIIVYYAACPFVSKVVIYETAEISTTGQRANSWPSAWMSVV